ncbi:hypothetical protein POM88_016216 [Heracleum sosnowskyi]|uniref:Protein kinase domain-containing protein n=1 Tax=Heracleum sosnowskyi TaxID=360622 RepID=A0AAD8MY90_9APIA|nr:hypothetical protein POM88_016216 [Heracleum sosnowskyi]
MRVLCFIVLVDKVEDRNSDYSAKVADFGLAGDGPQGVDAHVTTCVMGAEGYAAPEYIMTGLFLILVKRCVFTGEFNQDTMEKGNTAYGSTVYNYRLIMRLYCIC